MFGHPTVPTAFGRARFFFLPTEAMESARRMHVFQTIDVGDFVVVASNEENVSYGAG